MNNPSRKMESDHCWHRTMLLFLLHFCVVSASTSVSGSRDEILQVQALTGRNILQIKKDCPVNFELQSYTILTSGCKGPPYEAQPCCDAMREFACRFADELNNKTYDCGTPMLTYVYLHGFPGGLFTNLCHDTKDAWFLCPAIPPTTTPPDDANYHHRLCNPSFQLVLTASFLVLLLGF